MIQSLAWHAADLPEPFCRQHCRLALMALHHVVHVLIQLSFYSTFMGKNHQLPTGKRDLPECPAHRPKLPLMT